MWGSHFYSDSLLYWAYLQHLAQYDQPATCLPFHLQVINLIKVRAVKQIIINGYGDKLKWTSFRSAYKQLNFTQFE